MLRGWSSALVPSMEGMQGWGKVRVPRAPAQQNCCVCFGFLALLGPASLESSEPLEKRRSPEAGARANCSIEVRKSL